MKTLLQRIKQQQLEARKTHRNSEASILTTLIGEAEMVGKNDGNRETTDGEVVAVVKKFIKNIDEVLKLVNKGSNAFIICNIERTVLTSLLPHQLEDHQLEDVIVELIKELQLVSLKDMGKAMKALKERYEGRYDGQKASTYLKEHLK